MGSAVELLLAKAGGPDEDEAHGHLVTECPWYRNISEDKNCGHDPGEHCPVPSSGGALAKFTPHTAEASTVPEPTVPPGGPGLFHIKDRQLPPYVQHLWHHLAPKYGKQRAYGMAVGIVKKWAKGIHPGGKGGRVHPDVQAAAGKNVAQWEKDKADAHRQSAGRREHDKVRATSANPVPGPPYPGQKQVLLPPVPKVTRAMYTAHRLNNVLNYLAHAEERLKAAKGGKALRAYHMIHVNNHLSNSVDDLHKLVESLRLNYPAEYKELQALTRTMGLARAESTDAKVATFAHLLQTVLYHLAHAKRHAEVMRKPDPDALWQFNYDHAKVHTEGALTHGFKLARHIQDNYPAEAKYLDELVAVEDPGTDFTGLAAVATAPGAGPLGQLGPSITAGPRPPLPPKVPLPTAAELAQLAAQVPPCADDSLARSVRRHLSTAAVKMEKGATLEALAMLRSAQAGIYDAHKADLGVGGMTASVFLKVPADVTSAIAETRNKAMAWRRLDLAVGGCIDRIRKNFFGGVYSGPSAPARLAASLQVRTKERER